MRVSVLRYLQTCVPCTNAAKGIPQIRPTIDSARQAYLKLKWLLVARLYVKNAEIKTIFKKQKERIGDLLDLLDTEMEEQPKIKNGNKLGAWKSRGSRLSGMNTWKRDS